MDHQQTLTVLLGDLSTPDLERLHARGQAMYEAFQSLIRNRNFNEKITEQNVEDSLLLTARLCAAITEIRNLRKHHYIRI